MRGYFPMYGEHFAIWMKDREICEMFLNLFVSLDKPVSVINVPKTEQYIKFNKSTHAVRFDVVAESGANRDAVEYHIYCIEAQRQFEKESLPDRELYYGCSAMAAQSLDKGENYEKLRPVTIIFIHLLNPRSNTFVNITRLYTSYRIGPTANMSLHNDKLTLINLNLNNRFNLYNGDRTNVDAMAFTDLMVHGDEQRTIDALLRDPVISDKMKHITRLFDGHMRDIVKSGSTVSNEFLEKWRCVTEMEVYNMVMTTEHADSHRNIGKKEGEINKTIEVFRNLIGLGFTEDIITKALNISPDEFLEYKYTIETEDNNQ